MNMQARDDEFRDTNVVCFSPDCRQVRIGPRSRRGRRGIGGVIGLVCLAVLLYFSISQKPGWPIGVMLTLACLVFASITIFGPEPSIVINDNEIRCVRGKHVRSFPRRDVASYRYSRTHVSYVTFIGRDGLPLYKPIPLAV